MKKYIFIFVLLGLRINGCPTCVGRVTPESPAYFTDQFYQPSKKQEHRTRKKELLERSQEVENEGIMDNTSGGPL